MPRTKHGNKRKASASNLASARAANSKNCNHESGNVLHALLFDHFLEPEPESCAQDNENGEMHVTAF